MLITTTAALALILIAAVVDAKHAAALEFYWVNWEVDHPDSQPMYKVNQWKQQPQQHGLTSLYGDSSNQADKLTNIINLSYQKEQYNMNSKVSYFCIAWTCYQSTKTTQSTRTSFATNNSQLTKDSPQPFTLNVYMEYSKPYDALVGNRLVLNVIDAEGGIHKDHITPSENQLNGDPLTTTITFRNNEVPEGDLVKACIGNLDFAESGPYCNTVRNDGNGSADIILYIPYASAEDHRNNGG